jgi:peptide/nickel transport system substrate-binding protein
MAALNRMIINRRRLMQIAAGTAGAAAVAPLLGSQHEVFAAPAAQETPRQGGTLRIGYPEPVSLDPQYIFGVLEGNMVGLIFDSLMSQDPNTGEFIAGPLAESFTISEDQLSWTFKIRSGVTFHDGTPLTAATIKENYEHAADPANATYVTGIYLPPSPTFEAPDDTTLIISSPEPYGPMASHIYWTAWFGVYSPPARTQFGADFGRNPVGTGPFKFKEWVAGDHVTLERFDAYTWGQPYLTHKGPAYVDEIFFKIIPEQATIVEGLQAGEIDVAFLPNAQYDIFAGDDNFQILTRPSGRLDALGWNMDKAPFQDLKTRQALMYGFDRERFVTVMENGHASVVYGTIVPALPHYWAGEQEAGPKYDLEKAKQLLAEAGWADSDGDGVIEKDGQPFKLVYVSLGDAWSVRFASLIQDQAKQLGIDVQLDTVEQATVTARLAAGDFDLFHFAYDTVDPDILTFFFYGPQIPAEDGSGFNYSRINDPQLDALLDKQRVVLGAERDQVVADAVKYVMDNAYILPLFSPEKHTVVNKKVHGVIFYPNAMDWGLTEAWIEE